MNAAFKSTVQGKRLPTRNDEYLLYQTLVGAWPIEWPKGAREFTDRIKAYMLKAAREAKVHTSWLNQDAEFEAALATFIERALAFDEFGWDMDSAVRGIMRAGFVNSLAQCLLKITSPGLPDFYQGTELWNFRLVDPDNRVAVDYESARAMLDTMRAEEERDAEALARSLRERMEDGRAKLFLTYKALGFRKAHAELYQRGKYIALDVTGPASDNIVAFARVLGDEAAITIVPRLMGADGSMSLEGTHIVLPEAMGDRRFVDVVTGRQVPSDVGQIKAADALSAFHVALLVIS